VNNPCDLANREAEGNEGTKDKHVCDLGELDDDTKGNGEDRRGELSLRVYNSIIQFNPGYALAYVERGEVLLTLQHYKEAYSDFSKAAQISEMYSTILQKKSRDLVELGSIFH
jgi:hypothetical protein